MAKNLALGLVNRAKIRLWPLVENSAVAIFSKKRIVLKQKSPPIREDGELSWIFWDYLIRRL